MSKASYPGAPPAPRRVHSTIEPLAVVIATNLANAHSTGQYLTGLAALAFALAYDAVTTGSRRRTSAGNR
jgi:hypothetical protein